MDINLNNEIAKFLYADIDPEQAFHKQHPLLAHYTSMQNLENILRENQLWFSNPLYMNDLQEVIVGMKAGYQIFASSAELQTACGSREQFEKLLSYWIELHRQFEDQHLVDTYILSTSLHELKDNDGKLSMWRGYGGNGKGAAIVFDTAQLNLNADSPLIISKVDYITDSQRQEWLIDRVANLAGLLSGKVLDDDDLQSVAYQFFIRLQLFSLLTKHKGFEEEKEWRVVYMPEKDTQGLLKTMISYINSAKGLEPKLKFNVQPLKGLTVEDFSLSKIVDRIIIGPSHSSPFALAMMKRMLLKHGKPELENRVFSSKIPFRFK